MSNAMWSPFYRDRTVVVTGGTSGIGRGIALAFAQAGADVHATNLDGSTALHVASFLCWQDAVEVLVAGGAEVSRKNRSGLTPLDNVAGGWNAEVEAAYLRVQARLGSDLNLERIRELRPVIAAQLEGHGGVRGNIP